jgi:hypothetical protein
MTRPSWIIINFFIFLCILLLAAAMQTSLLHWTIGFRTNIQIVIVIITYICLYREPVEAFLFVIIGCYLLGLLSTMYASAHVFAGVCLFVGLRAMRKQVYSSNAVYFTWTALASILAFHIITWLVVSVFDARKIRPKILDWILEILVTALFSRFLYLFFIYVDKKTKRFTVSELNS